MTNAGKLGHFGLAWWWVCARILSSTDVHLSPCSGLRDEWGAKDVGDLSPGGSAQRSRPSASGEKSYGQHTEVQLGGKSAAVSDVSAIKPLFVMLVLSVS